MDEPFELKLARIARACHDAETEVARLRAALAEQEDECRRWSAAFEEARVRQNQTNAELAVARKGRDNCKRTLAHVRARRGNLAERVDTLTVELAAARVESNQAYSEVFEKWVADRAELAAALGERDRAQGVVDAVGSWAVSSNRRKSDKALLDAWEAFWSARDAPTPPEPAP